jgi:hypothetical protein
MWDVFLKYFSQGLSRRKRWSSQFAQQSCNVDFIRATSHACTRKRSLRSKWWSLQKVITSPSSKNLPNFIEFRSLGAASHTSWIYSYRNARLAWLIQRTSDTGCAFGVDILPLDILGSFFPLSPKSISHGISHHKPKTNRSKLSTITDMQ